MTRPGIFPAFVPRELTRSERDELNDLMIIARNIVGEPFVKTLLHNKHFVYKPTDKDLSNWVLKRIRQLAKYQEYG